MPRVTSSKMMPKTPAMQGRPIGQMGKPAAAPAMQPHKASHPGKNLGAHLHDKKC